MNKAAFSFRPSIELLQELRNSTALQKLEWLEEAHQFVSAVMSVEDFERWKRVAGGSRKTEEL